MADWLALLLAVFATYRLARMFALEEGPFGVFDRVRGRADPEQKTWLGRGVNCPLCLGWWIAGLVVLALLPLADWRTFMLTWFGVAGGMAALYLWLEQ